MCLIYQYKLEAPKQIAGEFHYYEQGNNGHHLLVERKLGNNSVKRWNTAEECYAQVLGLCVMQLGSDSMVTESNHHRFHFWRAKDGIHALCRTTVSGGFKDDDIVLSAAELPKLIVGYGKCILDATPPSESGRIAHLRDSLRNLADQYRVLQYSR